MSLAAIILTLLHPPVFEDSLKAEYYFDSYKKYRYQDYSLGLVYLDSGISLLRKPQHKLRKAEFLRNKGIHLKNGGALSESIEVLDEALNLFIVAQDSGGIAATCNNLGISYWRMGHDDHALRYYLKARDINLVTENQVGLTKNYIAIGNLYSDSHEYSSALENYEEAEEILKTFEDVVLSALVSKNMGLMYGEHENPDYNAAKSIEYSQKSIAKYRALGDSFNVAGLYTNLGLMYENEGKLGKGENYYQRALELQEELQLKNDAAQSYFNLGNIYLQQNRILKAQTSFEKSYGLVVDTGGLSLLREVARKLAEVYRDLDQFQKSLEFFTVYDSLDNLLYTTEKEEIIQDLQTKYETERKEKELALTKAEVDRRTAERDGYLIALAVFLALAIVLVWIYSQRQKAVHSLRKKEKDLHNKRINELLLEQEVGSLNAMLDGQETERKRISQELHDRVGSLLTAAKYAFEGNGNDPESLGLLDNALEETRTLSHSLASGVLAKFGLVAAISDLKDSIESVRDIRMVYKTKGFEGRIDQTIEIDLYRILQELVSNTLKHANADEITIHLEQTSHEAHVYYTDDGTGFDTTTQADGIGLKNIEARSKKYNGQLTIDSQPTKGMQLTLTIELLPDEKIIAGG